MAEREWPPIFRQDELAGIIMPGPDPAYLETARRLAHTAALAEAISVEVGEYPGHELTIIHLANLEEWLTLSPLADQMANEIGADPEVVRLLARAEVVRIARLSREYPEYKKWADARRIIQGLPDKWAEAA